MTSINDVWQNVLHQLEENLSTLTIETWFGKIEPVDLKEGTLLLYTENDFQQHYVESLYFGSIRSALKALFSQDIDVRFLTDEEYRACKEGAVHKPKSFFESEDFTFENFVVGGTNQLAYAAAQAVAEMPAERYNPLFIYGDSGLGKTHLIYAIAHAVKKNNKSARIAYVKGDKFTNDLIDAIRNGTTAHFREKYRQADMLLVDDVQFIAGKPQTEEEFFHTFNELYESRRQIVLTADRPPAEMAKLENRLQTRFEQGMMADIQPPTPEMRTAIAQNKAAQRGITLPTETARYIAERVTANVRQLEGAVNKVLAYSALENSAITESLIDRAIADIMKTNNRYVPTPDVIIRACSQYYNVEESLLRGKSKTADVVLARQVAMYLVQQMLSRSTNEIGDIFDKDHSTVVYSVRTVREKKDRDPAFAETIQDIKRNINEAF